MTEFNLNKLDAIRKLPSLKLDQENYVYVGCIPLHAKPTHPTDQSPCVIEKCSHCNSEMWVSEKKRSMRESKPDVVKIYCMVCLAIATQATGGGVELCDINKVN